jgi:hypothetical protein
MHGCRPVWTLVALACAVLIAAPVTAQPVRGIGDDALTAPRGKIRVEVGNWVSLATQRFGKNTPGQSDGSAESLGIDFSRDTLGVSTFPGLAPVQTALRTLTGNPDFVLSLGQSRMSSSVRTQTTPLVVEAGITNRLSFSVMVPLVQMKNEIGFSLNAGGRGGTASFNPVRLGDSSFASGAAATNQALVTQITTARDQLAALLATCTANPSSSSVCANVLASGTTVSANASAFANGIIEVYGTTRGRGSAFVPQASTAADSAIRNRVSTLRTQFQQFGITALTPTATGPARADAALAPETFQRAVADSTLRLSAQPLGTVTRRGFGDMEVALRFRLFDTFGTAQDTLRFLPKGTNLRQTIAAVYRAPTGQFRDASNFLDVSTGAGTAAIGVRSFTDILYGRHFFASIVGRYMVPMSDQQRLRITDAPDQVFAQSFRERDVARRIGQQLELEVTPRWVFADAFALSGQYLFRRQSRDTHTGTFTLSPAESGLPTPLTLNASTLDAETGGMEHRLGFGVTFSTIAAYARGKARFPLELLYTNSRSVAGSGGAVAKLSVHQVMVRVYPRMR